MRAALIAGLIGVLSATGIATTRSKIAPAKQWAIVNFAAPTRLGTNVLSGQCLIVHDDARMAKGAPCTTIHRYDPSRGPQERIVEFMCVPSQGLPASTVTLTVQRVPGVNPIPRAQLVGYQFAGDAEVHGLPRSLR